MEVRFKLNIKAVVVAVLIVALVVCLWSLYRQGKRNAANINVTAIGVNQIGAFLTYNIEQGKLERIPEPPAPAPAEDPAVTPETEAKK